MKDITGAQKIAVFADIVWSKDIDTMDVALDSDVPGEIKGSIDAVALDISLPIVRFCQGIPDADLQTGIPGCCRSRLSMRFLSRSPQKKNY